MSLAYYIHNQNPPHVLSSFTLNKPKGVCNIIYEQDCIPVGCVPPACWPYALHRGGVPGPGGVLGPGGCTWSGGVPRPGGCTWSRGVYLVPGGVPGLGGCTWSWGGVSGPQGVPGPGGCQVLPPWTEWQTGAKILPFPKLRLRTVINIFFNLNPFKAKPTLLTHNRYCDITQILHNQWRKHHRKSSFLIRISWRK